MLPSYYTCASCQIERGKKCLRKCLADVNDEEEGKVMQEQIKVVGGSHKIYELVDQNLRCNLIECSLWKETLDLYRWRKNYFTTNLGASPKFWFSNIRCRDTVAYQITQKFEQVVKICSSSSGWKQNYLDGAISFVWPTERLYLGVGELEVKNAWKGRRIDNLAELSLLFVKVDAHGWWREFLSTTHTALWQRTHLRYGDVTKLLFACYGKNSPSRLEELAMRKVKTDSRITLENLSRQVKMNDDYGFFWPETYQHDLKNMSQLGQDRLCQLMAVHKEILEKR